MPGRVVQAERRTIRITQRTPGTIADVNQMVDTAIEQTVAFVTKNRPIRWIEGRRKNSPAARCSLWS